MRQIYLDNAATSFPKPAVVLEAMTDYLQHYGGSPGRSAHAFSIKAARELFNTREMLASFFNAPSSDRVIFSLNATHALNMAIHGIVRKGGHVIISGMEHNSVVRPLRFLEQTGYISLSVLSCNIEGAFDFIELERAFKANTQLVITQHASNVSGTVFPIREIGKRCRQHKVPYMVDAAQSAGSLKVDMKNDCIDLLAFTGHKHLMGPTGTGGLLINSTIDIEPFVRGGSGSSSELEEHPLFYPDRMEAGTPNIMGIIGLQAALRFIQEHDMVKMHAGQMKLSAALREAIGSHDRIHVIHQSSDTIGLPIVSFTIEGMQSSEIALLLDREFGIMTRAGLHCAPLAHKSLGSFPGGTLRMSLGYYTTAKEIELSIKAIQHIVTS